MSCVQISYEKSNTRNIGFEKRKHLIPNNELKIITDVLDIQNSFRRSNLMCDVILITDDGVQIPAHKVILSSSSSFFYSLFTSDFKEKKEKMISIKEIDSDILETIIKYVYTFKLDITETNIEKLLKAIHFFDLERVMDKCCEFIENIINLENCLRFMRFAELFSNEKLYNLSFSYILEHFFKIKAFTLFELSYEEIITFISNNYLVAESEEQVFKFVLNWIKYDEESRKICLPKLMKHIRLPLISRKFFLDIFNEPLLRLHNECMILTIEAMMDHLMNMNPKHSTDFDEIGLSTRERKRIPKHLNKPDVILAIDNDYNDKQVSYIDIKSAYSDWVPGSKILIPPNRCSKIVALENGILFSIGGQTINNVSINDVFILDLSYICKKWIQTTSMIFARKDFAICIHEKRIYAIGGIGADGQILNTIEVFDINTNMWSLLCLMKKPRSHCSAIYHNNILYIIGGKSVNSERLVLVECLNELSLTWINFVPSLPEWCIHSTSVAIFNDTLYLFGGNGKKYHNELGAINTVFTCNLKNGTGWSYLSLLDKRQNASIALINEQIYIFGGSTSDMDTVDTTEIFDPRQSKFDIHCSNLNFKGQNVITFNKQLMNLLDLRI